VTGLGSKLHEREQSLLLNVRPKLVASSHPRLGLFSDIVPDSDFELGSPTTASSERDACCEAA
jgi:hypothetical protein